MIVTFFPKLHNYDQSNAGIFHTKVKNRKEGRGELGKFFTINYKVECFLWEEVCGIVVMGVLCSNYTISDSSESFQVQFLYSHYYL
ncbi:phage-related protein [Catalinimonas alkaloidigena]|nr:phage-related protein [Catalinimonas alkaloidigena]